MAAINLLRKAFAPLDSKTRCGYLSHGVRTQRGKSVSIDEQEPAAMTKRAGAKRHCPLAPAVPSTAVKAA
ncbi:MAG: hypothetical protein RSD49_09500 [Hafnia sp.]